MEFIEIEAHVEGIEWSGGLGKVTAHILQRLFTVSNGPDKWQPTQPSQSL